MRGGKIIVGQIMRDRIRATWSNWFGLLCHRVVIMIVLEGDRRSLNPSLGGVKVERLLGDIDVYTRE